jgi:hypothetical protein
MAYALMGRIAMQKALPTSIVVLLGLSGAPAKAIPFGSLPGGPPDVISVATGCGPGWTRRPYGHCYPMGGLYYGYRRYYHPHYHGYYYTSDQPTRDLQWLWNDP